MHWVNFGLNYGNNRSYTNEDILNRDSYTLGGPAKPTRIRAATSFRQLPISAPQFFARRVAEVAQELLAGRAVLGRQAMRGVSGGADNQDPEKRRVVFPEGVCVLSGRATA